MKKLNWGILFENFTLNFIVFLDFLVIMGLIIGKTNFLYSSFISLCLILSMAITTTVLYSMATSTSRTEKEEFERKKKHAFLSMGLKIFILFQLPKAVVNLADIWILLLPVALAVACFSFYYFWKSFQRELAPLFAFLGVAGKELSKVSKTQAEVLVQNIKAKTAELPAANMLMKRKSRVVVN